MARTKLADLDAMARAIDDALGLPRGTHFVQGSTLTTVSELTGG